MAEFECSGMDDLIKTMQDADIFTDDTIEELLDTGTKHLMGVIQEEASRSNFHLTGLVRKLCKSKKVKEGKDLNPYKYVTVEGKDKRGERNATKMFVLNYGRSKEHGYISGGYFWTRAVRRAIKSVIPIYEEIIKKKLEERGLI